MSYCYSKHSQTQRACDGYVYCCECGDEMIFRDKSKGDLLYEKAERNRIIKKDGAKE